MDIKQLVAGFKEQGMSDEDIASALESLKADIDAYLNPAANEESQPTENENESEDDKMARVFGF